MVTQLLLSGLQTLTLTNAVLATPAGPPSMVVDSTLGGPGVAMVCVEPPPPPPPPPVLLLPPPPPPPQALRNPTWIRARNTTVLRTGMPLGAVVSGCRRWRNSWAAGPAPRRGRRRRACDRLTAPRGSAVRCSGGGAHRRVAYWWTAGTGRSSRRAPGAGPV